DDECSEQSPREPALPLRLAAGDDGREEDSRGEEGGRGPEEGQLHVPGPGEVEGQQLGQVKAEEGAQVGAVVLDGATEQRLDEEERCDDEEEPGRDPLRRGDRDLSRLPEGQARLLGGVPADLLAPPTVE